MSLFSKFKKNRVISYNTADITSSCRDSVSWPKLIVEGPSVEQGHPTRTATFWNIKTVNSYNAGNLTTSHLALSKWY